MDDDFEYSIEDETEELAEGGEVDNEDDNVEIIDDTPEDDQGREPLGHEPDIDDDEIAGYSQRVQKRINAMKRAYHDERRAKEALARQQSEAIQYAQAILNENAQLKQTLSMGEKALIQQAQQKLAYDIAIAEAQYKKAYEEADTDALLEAQKSLYRVQKEVEQLENYRPTAQNLQTPQTPVYTPQQQPAQTRDEKAATWAAKNTWFGQDAELTSFALGVHENLVGQGVDPRSDDYYRAIEKRMREVFPDKFGVKPKSGSVVAPATRTTPSKKVTLTASQVAVAKRLGVPLEAYARQVAKTM